MPKREPNYLHSSDTISVSSSKLKKKYYDPKLDKIDINKIKSDITKIQLDINAINSGGLYYYDEKSNRYIKVFDDLKTDYIKILYTKKKGLEQFLNIVTYNDITIPESFKIMKKNKEE